MLIILGIPFDTHCFYCTECSVDICDNCHGRHDYTHVPKLLRFEGIQWQARTPDVAPTKICRHCAREHKARIECKQCSVSLCFSCLSTIESRSPFFKRHFEERPDDRVFLQLYPPSWSVTLQINSVCPCATTPGVFVHCDVCRSSKLPTPTFPEDMLTQVSVILCSQTAYACRTCRIEYGSAQEMCQNCWENHDPSHRTTHQFQTLQVVRGGASNSDVAKQQWESVLRCAECADECKIVYQIPRSFFGGLCVL